LVALLRKVATRYRELSIMNRVLNKDFVSRSYKISALITFSDVFHPASCMQSWYLSNVKESDFLLFFYNMLLTLHALPGQENLMRSGNAC
jgi:hypothetical protein